MRTREKVIVLLVGATLVLGALIFLNFRDNEVEANYFRWLFANKLSYGWSSPLRFLSEELPAGTFFYGGLALFAVVMTLVVLKMLRDGEIQALRSLLMDLRSEKHAAESLLQEQVWKGKHEQQAKDTARRDLEASIEKIELLLQDLNDKERELDARDAELMALKSIASADSEGGSSSPAERLLREEIRKKNETLQARDAALKDVEKRLNAKTRLWENQLREKDGLLKERDQELESFRAEIADLNGRLHQLESAKKRAEGLLQEELRQKKAVLEANALAIKAEEKRLGEKIRDLENQVAERDKSLRHRDLEMSGLRRKLNESEAARAQADDRLQEELARAERDQEERARLLRETEQRLGASIQALQSEVSEKNLLLQVREDESKSLQLEVKTVSLRLSDMAAAKARSEELLQEEIKKEKQQRDAERVAYQDLASRYDTDIKLLTSQLNEREAFLKRRDGELQALEQQIHAVTVQLAEAGASKEEIERLLREELKKEQGLRQAAEGSGRELEQRYAKEAESLKAQLSAEQESRRNRDQEIKSLKTQVASLAEQLAKVGSAKERAASLLQQTLKKEKQVLHASDSAAREIEESFKAKIAALEEQLQAKQELVGSRDSEVAALKSELLSLNQSMTDLSGAKARAESLLEEAVKERTELLQSKDAGIKKLEQELSEKIWLLESRLRESEEQLHSRDSELKAFKNQLDELTAAKEQAAHALHDELRQKNDLLAEKEAAINGLEERFGSRIQILEGELTEKQELLQARENEIRTLLSKLHDQAGQLTELGSSKDHEARLVEDKLRQATDLLQSKDAAMKALQDRLAERLQAVESQLGQKQELLEARDVELDALMAKVSELSEKLSEIEAERERADRLAQEELREKAALLQSKEASISELEERFSGRIESLERQLGEKQKLLEGSGAELSELRARVNDTAERLNQAEAAKMDLERMLQQERSKVERALVPTDGLERQHREHVNGEATGLETLLQEREQLLQARDKLIQNLMGELKEKKTQLARQEIEVWQKIERREAWKHRLSKIGIRLKD